MGDAARILRLMGHEQHRHAPFGLQGVHQVEHVVAQRRTGRQAAPEKVGETYRPELFV